jgi:phosphoserine phosphatase RsbU/P
VNKESATHVLLIEDNPGDADLVRLRLVEAHSDLAVSCVSRLSTGLASMIVAPPAMVLLDLNLPDSHGAETYRTVLEQAPGVPIVVLSGQDDEELAASAVHQGVQDYLVKGNFDSKQLARAMRYAIERQALLTSLDMSRRQQLQFKNEFLSHVSHELRTPLTCIHQFVSLMLDGLAGKVIPEQREHLETVFRSVNQLRAMITDLLEATRAESGKITIDPHCIVIGDVIRQAVAMLQGTAQAKGIGLEAGLDIRIPFIFADPNRVLQVLTNLVDNAIKFTPADGSVMVKACLTENDPDFVHVSVTDTGRGISPEAKTLIFERLYQDPNSIDDSRKGLGLGLYILERTGQAAGRTDVGRKPALPWQHFCLYPAIVFTGKISGPDHHAPGSIAGFPLSDHVGAYTRAHSLHRQLGRHPRALPADPGALHSRRQGRDSARFGPCRSERNPCGRGLDR